MNGHLLKQFNLSADLNKLKSTIFMYVLSIYRAENHINLSSLIPRLNVENHHEKWLFSCNFIIIIMNHPTFHLFNKLKRFVN